eukprot:scaffold374_cov380-Prasinococcus_capsulatus_cf.AAC.5
MSSTSLASTAGRECSQAQLSKRPTAAQSQPRGRAWPSMLVARCCVHRVQRPAPWRPARDLNLTGTREELAYTSCIGDMVLGAGAATLGRPSKSR